jgi:hypothetical protein
MRIIRATKERPYSKDRKRGRLSGIIKEETGLLKSMEKQRGN